LKDGKRCQEPILETVPDTFFTQVGTCKPPEQFYNKDRLPGSAIIPGTCDENCVNNELTPGKEVGRFVPFVADCNVFVVTVLRKCCSLDDIPFTALGGEFGFW